MFDRLRELFAENPRLWWVAAAAVASMLLVVWSVYGGFSFEIGRFFAAEPTTTERCPGRGGQPPAWVPDSALVWLCARYPSDDQYLDQQCFSWNEQRRANGGNGEYAWRSGWPQADGPAWAFPMWCVEKPADCPDGWTVIGSDANGACHLSTPAPGGTTTTPAVTPPTGAGDGAITTGTVTGDASCNGVAAGGVSSFSRLVLKAYHYQECPSYPGQVFDGGDAAHLEAGCKMILDVTPFDASNVAVAEGRMSAIAPTWTYSGPIADFSGSTGARCFNPALHFTGSGTVTVTASMNGVQKTITFVVRGVGGATPVPTSTVNTKPVTCAPADQTVDANGIARVTASGGDGSFRWDVSGGGVVQEGGNASLAVRYSVGGSKVLRVWSGIASATCRVQVGAANTATPTPSPSASVTPASLSIVARVRNQSSADQAERGVAELLPGQTAEYIARITNTGSSVATGVVVTSSVPAGASYQPGSTRVQGVRVPVDTITAEGLTLGQLMGGEMIEVRWTIIADRTASIPSGPQLSHTPVLVRDASGRSFSDNVTVTVIGGAAGAVGTGTTGGAGAVATGPGDAVTMALAVAAGLTFLYAAYTRSPAFRRREARRVSSTRDPMDFRN